MDTKQIITNFLNDQKSFKDFFSCIGEYIDGRFSSCKAVHDANVSLAEQNKDLFLECQRLEEKIEALEKQIKEKQSVKLEKTDSIKEQTQEETTKKQQTINNTVLFDEINPLKNYSIRELTEIFFVSDECIKKAFRKFLLTKSIQFGSIGIKYEINGQHVIDYVKNYIPSFEPFYRVSHLLDKSVVGGSYERYGITSEIIKSGGVFQFFEMSVYYYITHSCVVKNGLVFKKGSPSYKRFQKYSKKTDILKECINDAVNSEECISDGRKRFKKILENRLNKPFTICDFANMFGIDKKLLKLHLKELSGIKNNESFPENYTLPLNFVFDFVKKTNPDFEVQFPTFCFEQDENFAKFTGFVIDNNRFYLMKNNPYYYVLFNDIEKFNLKFKDNDLGNRTKIEYGRFKKINY